MKRVVIIGNSAAGVHAAEQLRSRDAHLSITIVSDEPVPPYRRSELGRVLSKGGKENDIAYRAGGWYEQHAIDARLNTKVENVNLEKQYLLCADKNRIGFDALIVASGMQAELPKAIKGAQKHGVLGFRTLEHVRDIAQLLPISTSVCIIGGGIAGLNAAEILAARNLEVKVIVPERQLLAGVIEEEAAAVLLRAIDNPLIRCTTERSVVEIFGNGDVKAVKLDSGKVIGCGIVLVDYYYVPRIRFFESTPLYQPQGLAVNEYLQTACPMVFAAGDVIARAPMVDTFFSWHTAETQGKMAADNCLRFLNGDALQRDDDCLSMPRQMSSLCGAALAVEGTIRTSAAETEHVLSAVSEDGLSYKKVVCRDGRLSGYLCINESRASETFTALMAQKTSVTPHPERLLASECSPAMFDNISV